MRIHLDRIEEILRTASGGDSGRHSRGEIGTQGLLLVLCAAAYGAAMGSWGLFLPSADTGERWISLLFSAIKVPLLLVATFLLSLPVLWLAYTLAGMRSEFRRLLSALVRMQAGLALILSGLAPLTLFWYASSGSYQAGVMFNALMFAVATAAARTLPRRNLVTLFREDPRHRRLLGLWIVLYIFTGIQMGWSLRPFIGSPGSELSFLRFGEIDNAWVTVGEMIWKIAGGK